MSIRKDNMNYLYTQKHEGSLPVRAALSRGNIQGLKDRPLQRVVNLVRTLNKMKG